MLVVLLGLNRVSAKYCWALSTLGGRLKSTEETDANRDVELSSCSEERVFVGVLVWGCCGCWRLLMHGM